MIIVCTSNYLYTQARRIVGNRRSRPVILVVPALDDDTSNSLHLDYISIPDYPDDYFLVGSMFQVNVPTDVASSLSYMVRQICT